MLENTIKKLASVLGVGLVRVRKLDYLYRTEEDLVDLFDFCQKCSFAEKSKAQLHQDVIVLLATAFKRSGFFVEFGATDGINLSNTYLLEKEYGWKGILAEPAKVWHHELSKNRNVNIDFSCVWSKSKETLSFNVVNEAELSTVSKFSDSDCHAKIRKNCYTYDVETISLEDLLQKYNAPRQIDYLSIDTEGSEFEILSNFDFSKYEISIISCEHNYTKNRDRVFNLLSGHGFIRKFSKLSSWDDWYFKESIL